VRLAPFGSRLKQEREKRGITLDAVALSTKIGTRFLRALEEEHFDQLPGGIFNRGFVRAYARCVGLDEDQTVADYLLASGEAQPKKTEVTEPVQPISPKESVPKIRKPKEVLAERVEPQPEDSGDASNFPWVPVASAIILVVLSLAVWRFLTRPSSSGSADTSAPATKTSTQIPQSSAAQTATTAPASTVVPNASPAPATFSVRIKASEDSWVSVTADGKPVFEDTMEELAEKSLEAHSEMVVRVGNLGGLDFWFNGTKLPLQGEEGEVKTLTFDTNGLRPQVPKPQPADVPTPSP
jgi:cytoskeletal protein RodZ